MTSLTKQWGLWQSSTVVKIVQLFSDVFGDMDTDWQRHAIYTDKPTVRIKSYSLTYNYMHWVVAVLTAVAKMYSSSTYVFFKINNQTCWTLYTFVCHCTLYKPMQQLCTIQGHKAYSLIQNAHYCFIIYHTQWLTESGTERVQGSTKNCHKLIMLAHNVSLLYNVAQNCAILARNIQELGHHRQSCCFPTLVTWAADSHRQTEGSSSSNICFAWNLQQQNTILVLNKSKKGM